MLSSKPPTKYNAVDEIPPPWEGRPVRRFGKNYQEVRVPIMLWPAYKEKYGLEVLHVIHGQNAETDIFVHSGGSKNE